MANPITDNIAVWTAAQTPKSNGGRGNGNGSANRNAYGIKKLRELILELAVCGKLVPQDPADEPASVLLEKIAAEKARLVKEGKIRKQDKLPDVGDAERAFELPNGWSAVRLGSIGSWAIGSGFPKKEQGIEGETILFSKVSDMNLPGNEKFIFTTINTVSQETAIRLKLAIHQKGTVVFPKIGGAIATNKRRILIRPTAIDNNCLGISPTCGIGLDYLYLYLTSVDLMKYQVGTSVPALSQGTLELIVMGLPPLAEQHRIVAKVDELMALCDRLEEWQNENGAAHQALVETLLATLTATANQAEFADAWQRIADHIATLFTTEHSIDQLKQTILQLAVMGKLVPQDPNDEPASVLLKKIAKEKARLVKERKIGKQDKLPDVGEEGIPFELPKGWSIVRLQELSQEISTGPFGTMIHKRDYVADGTPLINPYHMIDYSIVEEASVAVSMKKTEELSSYKLEEGDIVMARRGELGRSALVTKRESGWLCGTGSFRLRFHNNICRQYILLLFKTENVRSYLGGKSVGTTMINLNQGILNRLPIHLPPVSEQHRIVAKVDELMALCDGLKARLKEAQVTQVQLADAVVEQAVA